jgi:RecA/RadA recombinase
MVDDKSRRDLISQFNKEFPENPIEQMDNSDLAKVSGWVSTGNHALNWCISKSLFKGAPLGRIVLLSGDPSTGKSMISLSMMKQSDIDMIIYWDSEGGGASIDFATFLGINPKKVLYAPLDTIEELTKKMEWLIDAVEKNNMTKKILLVVDSISMLSTEKELNPTAGADMGNRAKVTRSFFRQYARKMQKYNICAVFTAHLTDNIGGYGPSKVVSGGTILGYAPSAEIRFAKVNAESTTEQSAKGTSLVKIRADMIKSRFGTTGKRVKFNLDVARGIDPYAGIFDILSDYEFVIPAAKDVEEQIATKNVPKKSTGWWMFKPWGHKEVASLYKRLLDEKIVGESGKFREDDIKEFCKNYEWFLPTIQVILDTIYEDPDPVQPTIEIEEPEEKPKKKKKGEKVEEKIEESDEEIQQDVPVEAYIEPEQEQNASEVTITEE